MQTNLIDYLPKFVGFVSVPALSVLCSVGGVWLIRTWLFARLSESIKHEYAADLVEHKRIQDEKLQAQKAVFETELHAIRHESEVGKLRTSLFFDHQRAAFQAILSETADTIEQWWRQYDRETYIAGAVPSDNYRSFRELIRKNRLFLDPDCSLILDILLKIYRQSLPFDDGGGGPAIVPDGRQQLDDAEYLQSRIASVFQMKIGVEFDHAAFSEVALLGLVRFLQSNRLGRGTPWSEHLVHDSLDANDAVAFARQHWTELNLFLSSLLDSLQLQGWMKNTQHTQLSKLIDAIQA